ncbi:MAG: hypothetical protein F6K37_13505 [Moorea sp. SIO4E2]|uniref:hypothetical protein n=1 Tax=Moorena sp. SIO4E2 TaxID=2607826 RepID=UPI0013B7B992|nr:hypothetical protein [Moorena sp. SIO4E2]NEQ06913.1 hypothetical protein [Moorena sp. SIO4E2]
MGLVFKLSAISYQLSAISYQLSAFVMALLNQGMMRDHLVLLKPPKSPNFAVRPKGDLLAHWKAHRGGL